MPSRSYADVWRSMHAKAFMVTGMTKQAMLTDMRGLVDKAISEGVSIGKFRKDFGKFVDRTGWQFKGGRAFRSRIIYDTNLRQSYNAGRWQQIQAVKESRPYLRYRHSGALHPRLDHLGWDGTVLPVNDPFWSTHYPQNGWGCGCKVFSESKDRLKSRGLIPSKGAPKDPIVEKVMPSTGEIVKVPRGIDPGFDTNIGRAAFGDAISDHVRKQMQAEGQKEWKRLTEGDPSSYGRPKQLEALPTQATIPKQAAKSTEELENLIGQTMGGQVTNHLVKGLGDTVYINAGQLAEHLSDDLSRSRFVPLMRELIDDPQEVWISFEQSNLTGKLRIRTRVIRVFETTDKDRSLLAVLDHNQAQWMGWTFVPMRRQSELNNQRVGKLLYAKEDK